MPAPLDICPWVGEGYDPPEAISNASGGLKSVSFNAERGGECDIPDKLMTEMTGVQVRCGVGC